MGNSSLGVRVNGIPAPLLSYNSPTNHLTYKPKGTAPSITRHLLLKASLQAAEAIPPTGTVSTGYAFRDISIEVQDATGCSAFEVGGASGYRKVRALTGGTFLGGRVLGSQP